MATFAELIARHQAALQPPVPWFVVPVVDAPNSPRRRAGRWLLSQGSCGLLLGGAGSGKTTLLTGLVDEIDREWLQERSGSAALLIPAHELRGDGSLPELIDSWACCLIGERVDPGAVIDALANGTLALALDGLDEISRTERRSLATRLIDAIDRKRIRTLLASSRTTGVDVALLRRLRVTRLRGLERADVDQVLGEVGRPLREAADRRELYALSGGNPLLLRLLSDSFLRTAQMPLQRTSLYDEAVDASLAVLAERWRPTVGQPGPDPRVLRAAFEALACAVYGSDVTSVAFREAVAIVASSVGARLAHEVIQEAVSSALLLSRAPDGQITFSHRSLLEFLVASSMREDTLRLEQSLLPGCHDDMLGFAIALTREPQRLLVAALDRRGLEFTLSLLGQLAGSPSLIALRRALAEHAAVALGGADTTDTVNTSLEPPRPLPTEHGLERQTSSTASTGTSAEAQTELPHNSLLARWRCLDPLKGTDQERGAALESFMVEFFSQLFAVEERNFRTGFGEFDLLLENGRLSTFWMQHGSDCPVECKFTKGKIGVVAIRDFADKLDASRARLAFFVSRNGFTGGALNRMRDQARDRGRSLIVPLTGREVELMLESEEDFELFFKRIVRSAYYLHSFRASRV